MAKCVVSFSYFRGFVFSVGVACVASAAEPDLAAGSPFLPPRGAAAAVAAPEPTTLELKGIIRESDGTLKFAIHNTAKKNSVWVKANETGHGFVVKSHRGTGSQQQVTIEHQGRTLALEMKTPKIASAGNVPMAGSMPVPQPTMQNAAAPTSAEEARRLENVAAEVARRRALRNQASGAQPPPPPQR